MRAERIWPNGLRYLWTDAFGLMLLVSLYEAFANISISIISPCGSMRLPCSAAIGLPIGTRASLSSGRQALAREIAEMRSLIERMRRRARDHPGPRPQHYAVAQFPTRMGRRCTRSLLMLGRMWQEEGLLQSLP